MFWNLFKKKPTRVDKEVRRRPDGTLETRLGHNHPGTGVDLASTDMEAFDSSR